MILTRSYLVPAFLVALLSIGTSASGQPYLPHLPSSLGDLVPGSNQFPLNDQISWNNSATIAGTVTDSGGRRRIATMPGTGGSPNIVSNALMGYWAQYDYDPTWSPDGTQIAFVRLLGEGDCTYNVNIWIVSAGGGGEYNLTNFPSYPCVADPPQDIEVFNPTWTPDGSQITFVYGTRENGYDPPTYRIVSFAIGGLSPTVVVDGGSYSPSWSPDGTKLAFADVDAAAQSGMSTYVYDTQSSTTTLLARDLAYPSWSPDGSSIAGQPFGDGIMVVDAETGTYRTTLQGVPYTYVSSHSGPPTWLPNSSTFSFIGSDVLTSERGVWTVCYRTEDCACPSSSRLVDRTLLPLGISDPTAADYQPVALELNQGVQAGPNDNSIPLITYRPILARAYIVRSPTGLARPVHAIMRLRFASGTSTDYPSENGPLTPSATSLQDINRLDEDSTFNFKFELNSDQASDLQSIQIIVNPCPPELNPKARLLTASTTQRQAPEPDYSNNTALFHKVASNPSGGDFMFYDTLPQQIVLVPLEVRNVLTGPPSGAQAPRTIPAAHSVVSANSEYISPSQSLMSSLAELSIACQPVSNIKPAISRPMTIEEGVYIFNGEPVIAKTASATVASLGSLARATGSVMVGVVSSEPVFNGLPLRLYRHSSSGDSYVVKGVRAGQSLVITGSDLYDAQLVFAHESGHSLGYSNPDYPIMFDVDCPQASTHHPYPDPVPADGMGASPITGRLVRISTHPIMKCYPDPVQNNGYWSRPDEFEQWITNNLAGSSESLKMLSSSQSGSAILTVVMGDSLIEHIVPPCYTTATPSIDDPAGDVSIELTDAVGATVFNLRVQSAELADAGATRLVTAVLDTTVLILADYLSVLDSGSSDTLVSLSRSPAAPVISSFYPPPGTSLNGSAVIEWMANDADGDHLTFGLWYSDDGGMSFIPLALDLDTTAVTIDTGTLPKSAAGEAQFRLSASDGFNITLFDQTGLTQPQNVLPELVAYASHESLAVGSELFLDPHAVDAEDGELPDSLVSWSSSIDGNLGTGSLLTPDLDFGTHLLVATVTDSDGGTTSDTTTVTIVERSAAVIGIPEGNRHVEPSIAPLRVSPNPFQRSTTMFFDLDRTARVTVEVFNVTGQRVRELTNTWLPAGPHELDWDGTMDTGAQVGSGVYFIRLRTPNRTRSSRVLYLR